MPNSEADGKQLNSESDSKSFQTNLRVSTSKRLSKPYKSWILDESCCGDKFRTRLELLSDELEYKPKGTNPGKVLIFHHEEYDSTLSADKRNGGRRDVNELIICFQRLGLNISEDDVYKDCTKEEINSILDKVSKEDLSNTNCLIVFFLSHGAEKDEILAYDGSLTTTDIWKKFDTCESLFNTPKMFVFQACKNEKLEEDERKKKKLVSESHLSTNEVGRDVLLVYSTVEGNEAFRNPKTGSWFIQELCKNFSTYGRRDDVLSLLIRTAKCVSTSYSRTSSTKGIQKQIPVFVSTLRRKFYINRNKDRHCVLNTLNSDKKNVEEVQQIQKIVQEIDLNFLFSS